LIDRAIGIENLFIEKNITKKFFRKIFEKADQDLWA
jgi:hypothetical protein